MAMKFDTCSLLPSQGSLTIDSQLSYGDSRSDNWLIEGDNLEVLRSLGNQLMGQVRCVYIDPPYNTAEGWAHFDDNKHHDQWLDDLGDQINALWPLIREDGSLWISINDAGVHYVKVLADQLLGRSAFVTTVVWEHRTTRENRRAFSRNHENILVYAPNPGLFRDSRNLLPRSAEQQARFKNPDDDPRGPWQSVSANVQSGHATDAQFYELQAPNGRRHRPPKGRCWVHTHDRMQQLIHDGKVWFGQDGDAVPRIKHFLAESRPGVTPETIWRADVAGTTTSAKRHIMSLLPEASIFDTPKPEELIALVIGIATNPGDLVIDSYLGSGTTAAVAQKMKRRWIGIESGGQVATHCAERLRLVTDGETGGVSSACGWAGGSGFKFMRHSATGAMAA